VSSSENPAQLFKDAITEHLSVIRALASQQDEFERIAHAMSQSILGGHKILWCGNGGSAADSQHLAAELTGRFRRERCGLPSIALTTDTSVLTAIGNDYGFERIFQRQVEALCSKGDILVGISTSGNSRNVCAAIESAKQIGAFTIAFTGEKGGALATMADATLRVASEDTARIQEGHILCGHILCDWVECCVCKKDLASTQAHGE
jgi:D-sedoheptulose 7-phosphate isomerase